MPEPAGLTLPYRRYASLLRDSPSRGDGHNSMSQEASITTSRIAFSTLAFPDADLATALSLGRSWGYAGVELRLIDGEPPSEGEVPVRDMPALLSDGDYRGWVSVEWEERWHPEIAEPGLALPRHLEVLETWMAEINERQETA